MTETRITSLNEHARLEAAADWLDQEEELSESERRAFEQWYADAANRAAYQRVARSMSWVQPSGTATKAPERRRSWIFPSAVAASLLLVTGLWALTPHFSSSTDISVAENAVEVALSLEARRGERRSRVLGDGSQLVLNAQSEVQVSLSSNERRVDLNQGQVFFNVAREEQRPFVVKAGDVQVRVLGTRFDIDRTLVKTTIAVYEGSVNVLADRSLVLESGEQVTLVDGHLGRIKTQALGTMPAWRSGWLDVSEEPLVQVVDHLQRYLEQEIFLPSGALAEQPVSGRFSLDRPQESLQLLADAHGLLLEQDQGRLRLVPATHR